MNISPAQLNHPNAYALYKYCKIPLLALFVSDRDVDTYITSRSILAAFSIKVIQLIQYIHVLNYLEGREEIVVKVQHFTPKSLRKKNHITQNCQFYVCVQERQRKREIENLGNEKELRSCKPLSVRQSCSTDRSLPKILRKLDLWQLLSNSW